MKLTIPPPVSPEIIESLRSSVAGGATQSDLIARMRALGIHQGRSIGLLEDLTGLPHSDAKRAVHFSSTWADCLQTNEALHEAAYQAAKQLGAKEINPASAQPASESVLESTR